MALRLIRPWLSREQPTHFTVLERVVAFVTLGFAVLDFAVLGFGVLTLALLVLVFPLPAVILGIAGDNAFLLALAFALQYAGLLAERWYFFAEANHPQNLYYQAIS